MKYIQNIPFTKWLIPFFCFPITLFSEAPKEIGNWCMEITVTSTGGSFEENYKIGEKWRLLTTSGENKIVFSPLDNNMNGAFGEFQYTKKSKNKAQLISKLDLGEFEINLDFSITSENIKIESLSNRKDFLRGDFEVLSSPAPSGEAFDQDEYKGLVFHGTGEYLGSPANYSLLPRSHSPRPLHLRQEESTGLYTMVSVVQDSNDVILHFPSVGAYYYEKISSSVGNVKLDAIDNSCQQEGYFYWVDSEGGSYFFYGLGYQTGTFTSESNESTTPLFVLTTNHKINTDIQLNPIELVGGSKLNEGLIAHYPFNGNANDLSGNDFHGVVRWATPTTDRFGIENNAYHFDGQTSAITIGKQVLPVVQRGAILPDEKNQMRLDLPDTRDFSISLWAKLTINDEGNILMGEDSGPGNQAKWYLYIGPTPDSSLEKRLVFYFNNDIYNGHWLGDEVPLNWDPKIWHHILVTKQSNEFSFYIDGRLHSIEETQAQVISNIDAPLTIGRAEKNPINGDLDEIRIYDKAFCAEMVTDLFNLESQLHETELPIELVTTSKETYSFPHEKTIRVKTSDGKFRFSCRSDALPDRFQLLIDGSVIYDSKYVGSPNLMEADDGIRESLQFYQNHGNPEQRGLATSELSFLDCCNAIDFNGEFFQEYRTFDFDKPIGVKEIVIKVVSPMSPKSPNQSIYNAGSFWAYKLERLSVISPEMSIKRTHFGIQQDNNFVGLLQIEATTKKGAACYLEYSDDLKLWSKKYGHGFEFIGDGNIAKFSLLPDLTVQSRFYRIVWLE